MQLDDSHMARLENFFAEVFGASGIDEGISKLTDFIRAIGLPLKMEIDEVDFDSMVNDTLLGGNFIGGGFVALGAEEIRKLLETVITVA